MKALATGQEKIDAYDSRSGEIMPWFRTAYAVVSHGKKARFAKGAFRCAQLAWPRTQSERLLVSMFDCSAAQALALLEVLADPARRTLLASPPGGADPRRGGPPGGAAEAPEVEIVDLYGEFFLTAAEIIAGGLSRMFLWGYL